MKKVKIMLLSLLVLGVAGGAMAFKAKFNQSFCTTKTINGSCPSSAACVLLERVKTTTDTGTPICTTAVNAQGDCAGVTDCTNKVTTITD